LSLVILHDIRILPDGHSAIYSFYLFKTKRKKEDFRKLKKEAAVLLVVLFY